MNDKPILFSAPMIRALLAGTKTQTRRVLCTADPTDDLPDGYQDFPPPYVGFGAPVYENQSCGNVFRFPRSHAIGDRLWVKETWRVRSEFNHLSPTKIGEDEGAKSAIGVWYEADDNKGTLIELGRTRSSIHMPRWASRLTLMVTDVRVQRLQDISEADAVAEGCTEGHTVDDISGVHEGWSARTDFRALWNSIHGPDAWDQNPWVAAYSVDVHRGNIDQMGG